MDGNLKVKFGTEKTGKILYTLLFSDLIIFTNQKSEESFSLERYFKLAGVSVIDQKTKPDENESEKPFVLSLPLSRKMREI